MTTSLLPSAHTEDLKAGKRRWLIDNLCYCRKQIDHLLSMIIGLNKMSLLV